MPSYSFLHNFRGNRRMELILTALVCVGPAYTFERFERLERTCIHRVTTIKTKVHHGGVALIQHRIIEPVMELRSN
jgi:hypothetical protein